MSALLRPMRRKHCVAGRVSRGTTAVFCAPIPNIRDLYVASDHVEVARETDLAVRPQKIVFENCPSGSGKSAPLLCGDRPEMPPRKSAEGTGISGLSASAGMVRQRIGAPLRPFDLSAHRSMPAVGRGIRLVREAADRVSATNDGMIAGDKASARSFKAPQRRRDLRFLAGMFEH